MPDNFRHKNQSGYDVKAPVLASTEINIGDIMWLDAATGNARTADDNSFTEDQEQQEIHDFFLGVAADSRSTLQTTAGTILVSTEGEFEYPCVALGSASNIGAMVTCDTTEVVSGIDVMFPQQLEITANANQAIGYLIEHALTGATLLKVRLFSTITTGGVQTKTT